MYDSNRILLRLFDFTRFLAGNFNVTIIYFALFGMIVVLYFNPENVQPHIYVIFSDDNVAILTFNIIRF